MTIKFFCFSEEPFAREYTSTYSRSTVGAAMRLLSRMIDLCMRSINGWVVTDQDGEIVTEWHRPF